VDCYFYGDPDQAVPCRQSLKVALKDPNSIRFAVDSMLGKLARWLRLLGYDTIYDPDVDDRQLAAIANQENRVLLTRDTRLPKELRVDNFYLVQTSALDGQLREVIDHFGLDVESYFFSRCSLCNEPVRSASRKEVEGKVPGYVFSSAEEFFVCPGCGRVYWAGSHYENARKFIEKIS
jgi:uncharacterized protein with PIN domain